MFCICLVYPYLRDTPGTDEPVPRPRLLGRVDRSVCPRSLRNATYWILLAPLYLRDTQGQTNLSQGPVFGPRGQIRLSARYVTDGWDPSRYLYLRDTQGQTNLSQGPAFGPRGQIRLSPLPTC